jgi:glycosyltransferase involved in cell wall biosynthesis
MSTTVLSVAYPFAPVGPDAVGGAEQVLTWLEMELAARSFQSVVVARESSQAAGQLLATAIPPGFITPETRDTVHAAHQANINRALASDAVDLVHMHGIDFYRYSMPRDLPVLVTLHLPSSWYPQEIWNLPANYHLQCVSETQRRACPAEAQARLSVVENGVPLPPVSTHGSTKGNFVLLLSRICPEKNLHAGLDAARLAGVPALLAGETFPYEEHLRYFKQEIEPRLGNHARLLGPVGGARKQELLAEARCLLLPTLAPETSSLTAMEALAAGTPVIAYPSGAIPEIVEHGRTGFLVQGVEEMAAAMRQCDRIDPATCRAVAASRFPLTRMVEGYMALYSRLASSRNRARHG